MLYSGLSVCLSICIILQEMRNETHLSLTHVSSPNLSTMRDLRQLLINPYCREGDVDGK